MSIKKSILMSAMVISLFSLTTVSADFFDWVMIKNALFNWSQKNKDQDVFKRPIYNFLGEPAKIADKVKEFKLSSNNQYVFVVDMNNKCTVYDTKNNMKMMSEPVFLKNDDGNNCEMSCAFGNNNKYLIVLYKGKSIVIQVCDIANDMKSKLTIINSNIQSYTLSDDSRYLCIKYNNSTCSFYDMHRQNKIDKITKELTDVVDLSISPDSKHVMVLHTGGTFKIYDIENNLQESTKFKTNIDAKIYNTTYYVFSENQRYLITKENNKNELVFIDILRDNSDEKTIIKGISRIWGAGPNNRYVQYLVTGPSIPSRQADTQFILRNANEQGERIGSLTNIGENLFFSHFSPSGNYLFFGYKKDELRERSGVRLTEENYKEYDGAQKCALYDLKNNRMKQIDKNQLQYYSPRYIQFSEDEKYLLLMYTKNIHDHSDINSGSYSLYKIQKDGIEIVAAGSIDTDFIDKARLTADGKFLYYMDKNQSLYRKKLYIIR